VRIWNDKTIEDALAQLRSAGSAIVTCESTLHAQRFRMAVYNYRRRQNIPDEFQLTISGVDVCFHRLQSERIRLK
jgi:2C-methyl-D-erythritol 2,4-cyclodiphosphate synthase